MTAPTVPATATDRPEITDTATAEEVLLLEGARPPCEVTMTTITHVPLFGTVHSDDACDHDASWILTAACHCEHTAVGLICGDHRTAIMDAAPGTFTIGCGACQCRVGLVYFRLQPL